MTPIAGIYWILAERAAAEDFFSAQLIGGGTTAPFFSEDLMLRILNIVGIGGGCFLISAFWVGKVDGLLLGLLGFSMIVIWLLGSWLYSTFFVIGKAMEKTVEGVVYVGSKIAQKAKEQKVFDRIGESMASRDNVVRLPHSKDRK